MANVLLICYRHDRDGGHVVDVDAILRTIIPADVSAETVVQIASRVVLGVADPVQCMRVAGASACLGLLLEPSENWYQVASGKPEGAFAIFRSDEAAIELITDALGQRTIWYAQTESVFVASTSQRAIVQVLGDFTPNPDVYPWMLATGTLGPMLSWDRRIRMVPPNSIVTLDRRTWKADAQCEKLPFFQSTEPAMELERRYRSVLEDTFRRISLDCSRLILPLSGGYDSRAILMMLQDRSDLRCFTIAPPSTNKYNTARIASQLADHYELPIQFVERENASDRAETVLDRFVLASEGRIDGITGYQDGFQLFSGLRKQGVEAVVWGDECYGWKQLDTIEETRRLLGLHRLADYENLPPLDKLGLHDIQWPDDLMLKPEESACSYFGRMYQDFRVCCSLSARVDCKSRYVEVLNPLMCHGLVQLARELPDEQRQWKRLACKVIGELSPDIPFNSSSTNDGKYRAPEKTQPPIWSNPEAIAVMREKFTDSEGVLPAPFLEFLHSKLSTAPTQKQKPRSTLRAFAGSLIPNALRHRLIKQRQAKKPLAMNVNQLAFRAYLIIRMNEILQADGARAEASQMTTA